MKLLDIKGKIQNVDIRQSSYPLKIRSKSILQQKVQEFLKSKYPKSIILEEFIIPGSRLSVDFFIPHEGEIYEIQGIQHTKYNPFFHGEKRDNNFAKQVLRDNKKQTWAEINGFDFIEIFTEDDIK